MIIGFFTLNHQWLLDFPWLNNGCNVQTIFHGMVCHVFPVPVAMAGTKKNSTVAESEDEEVRQHGWPSVSVEKFEGIPISHGKNPWFPVDVPFVVEPIHSWIGWTLFIWRSKTSLLAGNWCIVRIYIYISSEVISSLCRGIDWGKVIVFLEVPRINTRNPPKIEVQVGEKNVS